MIEFGQQCTLAFLCKLTLGDVAQDNSADPFPTDLNLGYRGFNRELFSTLA
jgi:hypothetical protein